MRHTVSEIPLSIIMSSASSDSKRLCILDISTVLIKMPRCIHIESVQRVAEIRECSAIRRTLSGQPLSSAPVAFRSELVFLSSTMYFYIPDELCQTRKLTLHCSTSHELEKRILSTVSISSCLQRSVLPISI